MANHMRDVAKLLGVEIGEEFCVEEREELFKISKTCIEYFSFSYGKWFSATPVILAKLLNGTYTIKGKCTSEIKWTPGLNKFYFSPCPTRKDLWECREWYGDENDYHRLHNGFVFKTSDEAIEMAKKMLGAINEEKE